MTGRWARIEIDIDHGRSLWWIECCQYDAWMDNPGQTRDATVGWSDIPNSIAQNPSLADKVFDFEIDTLP
jgi:hypothetical protein